MATIYMDVYGSIQRRILQEKKDAAETARPVLSVYSGGVDAKGVPFLNLRPVLERALARTPRVRTQAEKDIRVLRRACRAGMLNKAQARHGIERIREAARAREVAP